MYPQWKLKVYVDDIKIHVSEKNQEVLQAIPNVASKLKSVIQAAKLKLSPTEGREKDRANSQRQISIGDHAFRDM